MTTATTDVSPNGLNATALAQKARVLMAAQFTGRPDECAAYLAGTVNVRNGKGRKARVAVIDAEALGHLRAWLEVRRRLGINGRHPLFCSVGSGETRKAGRPLDSSYVRRLLPKLAERARIDKRVHAHGLRHSHATELVAAGVPLHVIAGQLGHASTATTDAYLAKIAPSERIAAMRAAGWALD